MVMDPVTPISLRSDGPQYEKSQCGKQSRKPDFELRCQFVLGFRALCCVIVHRARLAMPRLRRSTFSFHTPKEELPRGSIFETNVAAFHSSGE